MKIPHAEILAIRDALAEGKRLARVAYAASMDAGKFDRTLFDALHVAEHACIVLDVYVLEKLPAVEIEVAE